MARSTVFIAVLLGIMCSCTQAQLSEADKQELLAAHNHFRSIVDPIATNMERMVWNDELAAISQTYAEMCTFEHNDDRSAQSSTYALVGENLALTTAVPGNYTGLVNNWYDEVQDYDYGANTCSAVCGHYTQVVWATSNNVGCGAVRCSQINVGGNMLTNVLNLVCNYGPSGNINTATTRPYVTGSDSCTACPNDKPFCVNNLCSPEGPTPSPEPTAEPTQPSPEPTSTPEPTHLPPEATSTPEPTQLPPELTSTPEPTQLPPEPTTTPEPTQPSPEPTSSPGLENEGGGSLPVVKAISSTGIILMAVVALVVSKI